MSSDPIGADRAFAWIWLPGAERPVLCGRLELLEPDGRIGFRYARAFLDRPDAISVYSPELPLRPGLIEPPPELSAPGCILDAGPDAWGQRIILDRLTGQHGRNAEPARLNTLTYLLAGDSDRTGNLDFSSSSEAYVPRAAGAVTLVDLREAAERIDAGDEIPTQLEAALLRGSSIGGARPKALLDDGERRLIAKFSSTTDTMPVVQAEYVAMTLAARAGITTARVELASSTGKRALLVERFDRVAGSGQRRGVVSALTILGLDEMMARYASYSELAQHVRERFTGPQATLRELFSRITFNVLVSNFDDHARNHAAFWNGEVLELTPSYDICPQQRTGRTAEQAMYIGDERDNFKASEVAGCVQRAGLYQLTEGEAADIVDHQIETVTGDWHEVCDQAELTAAQRRGLWGRQFLNPGSLDGWTEPLSEPLRRGRSLVGATVGTGETQAMREIEDGIVRAPLDVRETLVLSGVAEAGGLVHRGATLHLSGVMDGQLYVQAGGHVEISGVFKGGLDNAGRVIVSGVFQGGVQRNDGELLARVGSIWPRGGRRLVLTADGSLARPPADSSYTITASTPLCRYVDGSFKPLR